MRYNHIALTPALLITQYLRSSPGTPYMNYKTTTTKRHNVMIYIVKHGICLYLNVSLPKKNNTSYENISTEYFQQ